jgi:hypothetical protein
VAIRLDEQATVSLRLQIRQAPGVERSGTLGIRTKHVSLCRSGRIVLCSESQELHQIAIAETMVCDWVDPYRSFRATRFEIANPGFRYAPPWAKFSNRFAVNPTDS